jgi:hypothetical protein
MNVRAWKVGVGRGRLILLSNQKSNRGKPTTLLRITKLLLASAVKRAAVGRRAIFVLSLMKLLCVYYH